MEKILPFIKAALWLLLEFIVFVIITAAIAGLFSLIAYKVIDPSSEVLQEDVLITHPYLMLALEYLPLFIGSIVSLYITHTVIFKRDFSLTGFIQQNILKEFSAGYILAFVMLLVGFLVLLVPGAMTINSISWNGGLFIGYLLFFLIQSSFEEIVSRSFMIPSISFRFNKIAALIVSSSIFAILHISNPSISWISILNIFLAGALMGLIFLQTKKIWAPIGLHAGWNFLQGSFFGFEVSGFDVYSVLDSEETGMDLFTGGPFGFEGSILASLLLSGFSAWIILKNPKIFSKDDLTPSANTSDDLVTL
jgi:membrane protease YdiL (CAAX protease family)